MTTSRINRRTATVLTAALALGAAGPAAAQPIGNHGPVPVAQPQATHHRTPSVVPTFTGRHMRAFAEATAPVPTATSAPVAPAHPKSGAPGSDLVYVLIGGGVVALGGLGGTLAAANRRRTAPAHARIAA